MPLDLRKYEVGWGFFFAHATIRHIKLWIRTSIWAARLPGLLRETERLENAKLQNTCCCDIVGSPYSLNTSAFESTGVVTVMVPEPASLGVLGLSALLLKRSRRRR